MTSAVYLIIAASVLALVYLYNSHLRTTYCATALKSIGCHGVSTQAGHGALATKTSGETAVRIELTPIDDFKAARTTLTFANAPGCPTLDTMQGSKCLSGTSASTLGFGGDQWDAPISDTLRCLGSPALARFTACEDAFFFDVDAFVTTDADATIHATVFTTLSKEYQRRLQAMSFRERLSAPGHQDNTRAQTVADALRALVELAQEVDGAARRHSGAEPPAFWRRAWRGTEAARPRADAFTVLTRILGEDAMWSEARAVADAADLENLWRLDPGRALDDFDLPERALLLGAPRARAPRLHDALLAELEPGWLDALDWSRARPILALLREKFGVVALTPQLTRLSRRVSDADRAELVSALGPDAEALTARGALSLSEDDPARGALTAASDPGGLSQAE